MGLLTPLFLLGAVAVALPFWLHRLQTQSSERQPFSSTMLLETTEQQVHLQKKLKHLVLLALRVCLLLVVALVFAKPFLERSPEIASSGRDGTYLVLVDVSASMGRDGVFDRAQAAAYEAIESIPADALIQVLAAADGVDKVSELSAERSLHLSAVSMLSVTALRLDFGQLMTNVDRLAESLPAPVRLHVISDFQDSAMPDRFADLVSVHIAELIPHNVGIAPGYNRRVEYVRDTPDGVDVGIVTSPGVGDGMAVARVELLLNDTAVDTRTLNEPGRAVLQFGGLQPELGDNRLTLRIDNDDDLDIDDRWFHVMENVPPAPIPLITLDGRGLPVRYLSAALQSNNNYRVEPMLAADTDFRTLARYQWVIVDDLSTLDSQQDAALGAFVQAGGSLLAFVGERAAGMQRLPISGHQVRPASVGADANEFLTIGQLDVRHPVLSRTEGWFNVNVTRNISVELLPGDQVLMRLENDVPLLIERRIGKGRLLLLTAGLGNQWNDLPIRPVFVGFMIEAARYLSGVERVAKAFTTGDTLPLSLVGGASGQVLDPEGNAVLSLVGTTRAQQIKLAQPGYYEVYTPKEDYIVGVNTDPRESDLNMVASETMQRWVRGMGGKAAPDVSATTEFQPEPLELWHALLLVLAFLVIGESMLGNASMTLRRN